MGLSSKFSIRQDIERKKRRQLHDARLKSGRLPFAVKPVFAFTHFTGSHTYTGELGTFTKAEFETFQAENTDITVKTFNCLDRPCRSWH